MPNCTYRKTQAGQWVVCGPVSVVRPGTQVTVYKSDGTTKTELIETCGRPFGDNLVYGYIAQRAAAATVKQPTRGRYDSEGFRYNGRCKAPGCSATATDRGYCKQCAFDEFDD